MQFHNAKQSKNWTKVFMKDLALALRNAALYFLEICGIAGLIFGSNFVWKIVTYFSKPKSTCNMFSLDKASKQRDSWKRMSLCFNLEYYRFFLVTSILSSVLPDPVFKKKKKKPFPSTAVYHKNYTENISFTEQFEHLQS